MLRGRDACDNRAAALIGPAYARNVSGAIGSRVTGGDDGAAAGSTVRAFCAGCAVCLRWSELAASAAKAGSSSNTIAMASCFK